MEIPPPRRRRGSSSTRACSPMDDGYTWIPLRSACSGTSGWPSVVSPTFMPAPSRRPRQDSQARTMPEIRGRSATTDATRMLPRWWGRRCYRGLNRQNKHISRPLNRRASPPHSTFSPPFLIYFGVMRARTILPWSPRKQWYLGLEARYGKQYTADNLADVILPFVSLVAPGSPRAHSHDLPFRYRCRGG